MIAAQKLLIKFCAIIYNCKISTKLPCVYNTQKKPHLDHEETIGEMKRVADKKNFLSIKISEIQISWSKNRYLLIRSLECMYESQSAVTFYEFFVKQKKIAGDVAKQMIFHFLHGGWSLQVCIVAYRLSVYTIKVNL